MRNDTKTHWRSMSCFVVTWIPPTWQKNRNELHKISTHCWAAKIPLQFTDTNFTRIKNKSMHVITLFLGYCSPSNDRTFTAVSKESSFNKRRSSDQSRKLHKSWLIILFLIIPESMSTFPIVFGEFLPTRAWYLVAEEYIEWVQVTGAKIFQFHHLICVLTSYFWSYYLYQLVPYNIFSI